MVKGFISEAALMPHAAASLFAELVEPMLAERPLLVLPSAKHEASPPDVGATFCVLHGPGLCDNHVLPELVSARWSCLSSAEADLCRLAELSITQWQSLAWWTALHACLDGYGAPLPGRTHPPGLMASPLAASCPWLV